MALPSFLTPYRLGAVALVFILGVVLSVFIWRYAWDQDAERVRSGFRSRAQTQASVANQRLRAYREMVYSLRDSFLGQQTVSRHEFTNVAQALLQRHAGVQALQWVEIVPGPARAAFERRVAQELRGPFVVRQRLPDNSLVPASAQAEHFVITFVEPLAGNEPVLGYDVLSAPSAPLLQAARQDREFKVTQTFPLAQMAQPGVVFILPFWRLDQPGRPVEGFIQGVFLVQTMLAQSHDLTTNEALDTYYFDTTDGNQPTLLYANLAGREPLRGSAPHLALPALDDPADFHTTISLGNRTWRMIIRPNAGWVEGSRSPQPMVILLAGLMVTVLFTGFVNNLFQRTAIIEQEVHERTRQLKASEARLQDIVDHSPAIIFVKDLEGRHVLCNEPFAAACRRSHAEIIGRTDLELFGADQAALFHESDQSVLRQGRPVTFEQAVATPAGSVVCIVQKFPLLDEQGRVYALCGIATDITERKAAEAQRLELDRKLFEAQKLESLGVLAGGVAHDFNNILTSILGNASLAALDLPETHKARRQLVQIERASHRAADLCAQLLAYAGRASFVTAPVNLARLVRDTADLLEVSLGKRGRLELLLPDNVPAVMGDPTQLRQIVMNLVINAADAMEDRKDGQVIVRVFTRDLAAESFAGAIRSPVLPAGPYVGLEVADNGSGMAPEVKARIFEPFFTTKFSGRGLGLAAVLGIMQRHDGALFVDSTPGQGTTFRLFFPASSTPATNSAAPFEASARSLRGTVLVVDDEESVRLIAQETLCSLGLVVHLAARGEAALDLLSQQNGAIDLVLLDLTMPGLPGDETLRRIRQVRPDLRVIIMSGYSEGETMQRCASLGVADYLPKPFDVASLTRKLRPHLG